jgi:hypothetical protein
LRILNTTGKDKNCKNKFKNVFHSVIIITTKINFFLIILIFIKENLVNRKKLLLEEELKRISQLMGVSYNSKILLEFGGVGRKILLMEAFVPPPKGASGGMEVVLKSLFGDEVAERFARSAADEWSTGLKQLAELVEREGLDDIGKFVDNLKIQKGGAEITQEVLEDAMRKYMRSNPDVLKDILKSSSDYLNKVIGETTAITRIRAVNPALADEIQNIATIRIDATNAATYRQDFVDLADLFRNSGLDMTDASNKKILDGLESKVDMADAVSGTISKPVSDEAVPLVSRTEMRTGKTADELAAEEAERVAREEAEAEAERIRRAEQETEENFRQNKNQKVDRALETLMSLDEFSKAWSWWVKLCTTIGFNTNKAKLIARARQIFGEMTLSQLDNITRTQQYESLAKEVKDKAAARQNTKGVAGQIDGASKIVESLTNFIKRIPGGKITLTLISSAVAFVILSFMAEDTMFDFSDNWRKLKDYVRDNKFGDFVFGPANEDIEFCLRQINGYYDIPDEDRYKINTIGLTCDNIDQSNFDTFISKIEYLKGGTVLDSSGNKVTKKDRFKITMGDKVFEKEVGSNTTNSSTTTTTTAAPSNVGYDNNKAGFIKWVGDKHKDKYGTEYEWDDATKSANYYENGGDVGKPLTYKNSTVGWE